VRPFFTILILGILNSASGQNKFDSAQLEQTLTTLPKALTPFPGEVSQVHLIDDIIKAIEAVDKKYRRVVDTLFPFKSLRHTILQTTIIETNDSLSIYPLTFGDKIKTSSVIFGNAELNTKVDRIASSLTNSEKDKLYEYLKANFDHFSTEEKKLNAQPVRIKYVKFPNNRLAQVGIDIYGAHYLWTIDKIQKWDVVKVEQLWVY
jgi:hypothetical protein